MRVVGRDSVRNDEGDNPLNHGPLFWSSIIQLWGSISTTIYEAPWIIMHITIKSYEAPWLWGFVPFDIQYSCVVKHDK